MPAAEAKKLIRRGNGLMLKSTNSKESLRVFLPFILVLDSLWYSREGLLWLIRLALLIFECIHTLAEKSQLLTKQLKALLSIFDLTKHFMQHFSIYHRLITGFRLQCDFAGGRGYFLPSTFLSTEAAVLS